MRRHRVPHARLGADVLTPEAIRGLRSLTFRWAVLPSFMAWLLLLWLPNSPLTFLCIAPRPGLAEGLVAQTTAIVSDLSVGRLAVEWGPMIVAMMFPLLIPMIGHIEARSFKDRRDRSIGIFIGGYVLTWLIAVVIGMIVLVLMRAAFALLSPQAPAGLVGAGLAALWQLSPAKRRAINRCHGTIALRAFGRSADTDAFRFGILHGFRCIASCFPLMIFPSVNGGGIMLMAVVFILLLAERANSAPPYHSSAVALMLLGITSIA